MASILKKGLEYEIAWLNKTLDVYRKALNIAIKYENKEKEGEYKKEIEKITEQLNQISEKQCM